MDMQYILDDRKITKGNRDRKQKACKQVMHQKIWNQAKDELSDHRTKG